MNRLSPKLNIFSIYLIYEQIFFIPIQGGHINFGSTGKWQKGSEVTPKKGGIYSVTEKGY